MDPMGFIYGAGYDSVLASDLFSTASSEAMVRELFEKDGDFPDNVTTCKFAHPFRLNGNGKMVNKNKGMEQIRKKHVILRLMVSEIRRSPPGMYKTYKTLLIMGHLLHQLVSRILIHQRYYHQGQGGPLTPLFAAVSLLGTWLDQQTNYIGLLCLW